MTSIVPKTTLTAPPQIMTVDICNAWQPLKIDRKLSNQCHFLPLPLPCNSGSRYCNCCCWCCCHCCQYQRLPICRLLYRHIRNERMGDMKKVGWARAAAAVSRAHSLAGCWQWSHRWQRRIRTGYCWYLLHKSDGNRSLLSCFCSWPQTGLGCMLLLPHTSVCL